MLKGKTALVTGSTSGIGLGIAKALARQGANIVLNGFGDVDGPKAEIAALGVKAAYHGADMGKASEIEDMMRFSAAQFGRVDILVNNAGIQHVASIEDFRTHGKEASVVYAITTYMPGHGWLAKFVTVAILAGFSSVILVMLLGQSRVFFSLAHDGLVPEVFAKIHPKYGTPYKTNLIFLAFVGAFAAFVPGDIVGDMTSIGTLFAFILVCAGVWIMRVRRPDVPRGFVVPALPLVSTAGIVVCAAMIFGLGWTNWLRLAGWLALGLVVYFVYGRKHSIHRG